MSSAVEKSMHFIRKTTIKSYLGPACVVHPILNLYSRGTS